VHQASSVVRRLFSDGASIVALCEMDVESAARLQKHLGSMDLDVLVACDRVGKSRWDIVVVSDRQRVRCEGTGPQTTRHLGTVIRSAQSFDVLTASGSSFRLYVAHWRSRLGSSGHDWRKRAAIGLCKAISDDLETDRAVVVLGDFNEEPFDSALAALHAVRDPRLVCRHPKELLFNASWSLAGPPRSRPWGTFGSYGYGGRTSLAYQLDQALVSAHFLAEHERKAPVARNSETEGASHTFGGHLPLELELQ